MNNSSDPGNDVTLTRGGKRATRKRGKSANGTRKKGRKTGKKNSSGNIVFDDYPEFRPNLTPQEIFKRGSFGGTYWRPIYSSVTKKHYKNKHKAYPASWWKGIPNDWLTRDWDDYDTSINKYGVKVGTTLEFWECKKWIHEQNPYGWMQWYCDFYTGKRGPDDQRQIDRWKKTAGPRSRFRRALINLLKRNGADYNDFTISPKVRQTLQHWGYVLTKKDFNAKYSLSTD